MYIKCFIGIIFIHDCICYTKKSGVTRMIELPPRSGKSPLPWWKQVNYSVIPIYDGRVFKFCLVFLVKLQLAPFLGSGNAFGLPTGIYLSQHHPITEASGLWSWLMSPRSPGCSDGWCAPLCWWPYSRSMHMSSIRVAATWRRGVWPGISEWPPSQCPTGHPLIQWRVTIDDIVGDRHPST